MPIENALGFLRNLEGSRPLPGTIVVFGPHGFLREFVVSTTAGRLAAKGYKYRSIQIGAGGDLAAVLDELGEPDLFAAKRRSSSPRSPIRSTRRGSSSGSPIW
jgi:hypothetical protein